MTSVGGEGCLSRAPRESIRLRSGQWVVGQHLRAETGKPTFVLVNGFVSSFTGFDQVAKELHSLGAGVVRYDFTKQGETIQKNQELGEEHLFTKPDFSVDDLGDEANQVLTGLKVPKGSVIVGLSYGALVLANLLERYPEWVGTPVLLSPAARVSWRHMMPTQLSYTAAQVLQPWTGSHIQEFTERRLDDFVLKSMIFGPYRKARPKKIPPELFSQGLGRLEEIGRNFEIRDLLRFRQTRFHLLMAKWDSPLSVFRMREFFNKLENPGQLFVFPSPHGILWSNVFT